MQRDVLIKSIALFIFFSVIFVLMLRVFGVRELMNTIGGSNPSLIFLAILIQLGILSLWSLRWKVLTGNKASRLFQYLQIGILLNNVTPSARTGGEIARVYLLGKMEGIPYEKGLASVVLERTLDLFVLAIISIFLIPFSTSSALTLSSLSSAVVLVLFSYFIYKLSHSEENSMKIVNWVCKGIRRISKKDLNEKLIRSTSKFHESLKEIEQDFRKISTAGIITSLMWFFTFCRTELVLLSIGQSLPIWQIALVTLVYSVAGTLFFLTPGGIGAVEISSLLLYTKLGLEREIAASLVLLDRCIGFLFPSAMGLFFLAILSRKIALESY